MTFIAMVLTLGLLAGSAAPVSGQSATDLNSQATTMNSLASSAGESNVISKTSSDFSSFLGADANAVVTGVCNGTRPTGHIGDGNVLSR